VCQSLYTIVVPVLSHTQVPSFSLSVAPIQKPQKDVFAVVNQKDMLATSEEKTK